MALAKDKILINKTLYVLVADSALAKLYCTETAAGDLEQIECWKNEEGRLKDAEIYTDRPGGNETNRSGYHTYAREKGEDEDDQRFARDLSDFLEKARQQKKFEGLVLVAAPQFLGTLRQNLSKECQDSLEKSIDKDLVHHDKDSISEHLSL